MRCASRNGRGPALTDVMAGFVQLMSDAMPSALPLIRSDTLSVCPCYEQGSEPLPRSHGQAFGGRR
jgi:tripartite-type tricarboxylate transporter receptor subunit TctC